MKDEKQKILIVDDDHYNLIVLTDILKPAYKTIVAKKRGRRSQKSGFAETSRPYPARHHDAGDGRIRGVQAVEKESENHGYPGDIYNSDEPGRG